MAKPNYGFAKHQREMAKKKKLEEKRQKKEAAKQQDENSGAAGTDGAPAGSTPPETSGSGTPDRPGQSPGPPCHPATKDLRPVSSALTPWPA